MKEINILFISAFLIFVLSTCRKEQPEMTELNKNCDCAHEVTADFYMEEMVTPIDWPYARKSTDTDTIYANKNVWFHPVEKNAEYTWYLGLETLTEEEIYRYFSEEHVGETYPMTLVVKKKPNTICFPNDDGYDSIVRYLTIVEKIDEYEFFNNVSMHARFEGIYRVKDSNMADSIDLTFDVTHHIEGTALNNQFVISGYSFYGELDKINFGDPGANYRQFWFNGNYCYGGDAGVFIYNRLDGVFEFKLTANPGTSCSSYHFYGRKL